MLRHTFCHLPGVALRTEQRLWSAGLTTWEEALAGPASARGPARRLKPDDLHESARRHSGKDARWFAERLSASQSWRLFADFRYSCAYLDIETTGMSASAAITTIALYDGKDVKTYIQGQNLHDFSHDIQAYQLLVTYNGKSFDVPVLRYSLGCALDHAHVDLRHVLASVGLTGGLKACERKVGIVRPGLAEVDGALAVLFWHEYRRRKDPRALETLLAYNVQDVLSLELLMVHAHNALVDRLEAPFAPACRLPEPKEGANPFQPDADIVRRALRQREQFFRHYS